MQYGTTNYSMGDTELVTAAANAPVTPAQALAAKAELARMRATLGTWLKYRAMNNAIAAGKGNALPSPLFKKPGASLPSPAVMGLRMRAARVQYEAELAEQLHALLSEVFDATSLPSPDVTKNPDAAVQLAQIVIAGQLPTASASPDPTGMIWLWPVVVIVGAIAFVLMTAIRSSAEEAAEHEKIECIKAGKCTDAGFWMKVGGISIVAWLLWDKAGVGARVKSAMKGGRR